MEDMFREIFLIQMLSACKGVLTMVILQATIQGKYFFHSEKFTELLCALCEDYNKDWLQIHSRESEPHGKHRSLLTTS